MKGFEPRFIEELKNKNEITDVVSRYVRLEKKGANFWGVCPFHHEKTPSFSVNPNGQYFYCFGCHKSGDVITFVSEMESLDFSDAVKFLAERAHMQMPEERIDDEKIKEQKRKRERLLALLKDAARFYYKTLHSGECPEHVAYALKRGLTDETINLFGIGASKDYRGLVNHLKAKGYSYEEMVDSGAVGRSDRNGSVSYYDALAGRLIIPVIDQFGNVIAFCGRIIEKKDGVGKYVNTRETQVFSKGKTLFNLNNLKKFKNEHGLDCIIIVEGHMDVVSLVQGGVKNVVASMGTALTKDQARILKRYTDKVVISYDGDFAGQKASVRGLEILKEEGLDVKVAAMPDGLDPDDVVKKFGADKYREIIAEAMPLIDFKLDIIKKTFDVKTADGRRKYVSNSIKVIKESPSPAEQEDLLKTVRDVSGITMDALRRELYSLPDSGESEKKFTAPAFGDDAGDKVVVAERYVLSAYLFDKPYAAETDVREAEFTVPAHAEMARYIAERQAAGEKPVFSDLYEELDDHEELSRIAGMETGFTGQFDGATYFADCLKTIKTASINRKIAALEQRFAAETDAGLRLETVKAIDLLMKEKNKLQ